MPTCGPIKLHPALRDASVLKPEVLDGVDLVFVRELTGGIYFGEKKRDAYSASDLCTYSVARSNASRASPAGWPCGAARKSSPSTSPTCSKLRACGARSAST